MKVVSRETSVKYKGQRHWANQPFDLDTDYIPNELKDFVVEYDENVDGKKEEKVRLANIRVNGLLKKDNPNTNINTKKEKTGTLKTKSTSNKGRKPKSSKPTVKENNEPEINTENLLTDMEIDNLLL